MKTSLAKSRMALCALILLAVFLPAYNGYSAVSFIPLVLAEVSNGEINLTDAAISIIPVLLVPVSAIVVGMFQLLRIPLRRVYVAMPLVFLLFFTGILFTAERSANPSSSVFGLFKRAGLGFYLAYIACLLLPFTKNAKRRRRHRKPPSAELAQKPEPEAHL